MRTGLMDGSTADASAIAEIFTGLEARGAAALAADITDPEITFAHRVDVQYKGQAFPLTVEIDPRASVVGGRWVEDGGSSVRSGGLSGATIDYFGGQGDRPSIGGQFTLSNEQAPVYRINLPRTRLSAER